MGNILSYHQVTSYTKQMHYAKYHFPEYKENLHLKWLKLEGEIYQFSRTKNWNSVHPIKTEVGNWLSKKEIKV